MTPQTTTYTLFPYTTLFRSKQRVLIEGVRIIKKHLRKSQDNPQGKIAEREGPIHISNVKLIEREKKAEKKTRSEEHTSELQSRVDLVCRLLLEKKKKETEHK